MADTDILLGNMEGNNQQTVPRNRGPDRHRKIGVAADDPELLDIEADAGAPDIDRILPPLCRDHRNVVIFGLVGRLDRIGLGVSATSHTHENLRHQLMRSEEHTSELQSLMRISYDVFCLQKKTQKKQQ